MNWNLNQDRIHPSTGATTIKNAHYCANNANSHYPFFGLNHRESDRPRLILSLFRPPRLHISPLFVFPLYCALPMQQNHRCPRSHSRPSPPRHLELRRRAAQEVDACVGQPRKFLISPRTPERICDISGRGTEASCKKSKYSRSSPSHAHF